MKCIHLNTEIIKIPQLGGPTMKQINYVCGLKTKSELKRISVYDELFKRGLEGSIITNNCPVAHAKQWTLCPFFEENDH